MASNITPFSSHNLPEKGSALPVGNTETQLSNIKDLLEISGKNANHIPPKCHPEFNNKPNIGLDLIAFNSPLSPIISNALNVEFWGGDVGKRVLRLDIVHTNDAHGAFRPVTDIDIKPDASKVGGLAYRATVINEIRKKNPGGVIVLDAGDIFEGELISTLSRGDVMSKPLNIIGYDGYVLGNHDFSWGNELLLEFIAKFGAPCLSANLKQLSETKSFQAVSPFIEKDIKGVKVAVLGISDTSGKYSKTKGIDFEDPVETAKKYLPELRKRNDIVIVLSHLGIETEREFAMLSEKGELPHIDVIVGGHSHTLLPEGEKIGNTIIVQAGANGKYVGDISLDIDPKTHKILNSKITTTLVDPSKIKPNAVIEDIINEIEKRFEKDAKEKIGEVDVALPYKPKFLFTPVENLRMMTLFMHSIKQESDISLSNVWSLRDGLAKGEITTEDLYRAYPFDNNLYKVKAEGKAILGFLEKGLNFMGKEANLFPVCGLEYTYDTSKKEGEKIISLKYKGKNYTPDEFSKLVLEVSIDDYNVKKIDGAEVVSNYGKVFDILKDYIRNQPSIEKIGEEETSYKFS